MMDAVNKEEIEEALDLIWGRIMPVVEQHAATIRSGLELVANAIARQAAALENSNVRRS